MPKIGGTLVLGQSGKWVTADFVRYTKPLVGPLPELGILF